MALIRTDFPTATIQALIQQNKTLSAKLTSFLQIHRSQEEQLKKLKTKCDNLQAKDQMTAEENKKLKNDYQALQTSYQKLKEVLMDMEQQFALQYTDFLEKKQVWKAESSKLQFRVSLLSRYRKQIQKRVKPYIQRLKLDMIRSQKEHQGKIEKIIFFQKQLKEAYQHIQKLSSDYQQKEKVFQKQIKQANEHIQQREAENQQSLQCIVQNQYLKKELLEAQSRSEKLEASFNTVKQEKAILEKQYLIQTQQLKGQVHTLTDKNNYLLDQLKILQNTLMEQNNRQSQVSYLWQKKLTTQIHNLQKNLNIQNTLKDQRASLEKREKQIKTLSLQEQKRPSKSKEDLSCQVKETYQAVLKVQAGLV